VWDSGDYRVESGPRELMRLTTLRRLKNRQSEESSRRGKKPLRQKNKKEKGKAGPPEPHKDRIDTHERRSRNVKKLETRKAQDVALAWGKGFREEEAGGGGDQIKSQPTPTFDTGWDWNQRAQQRGSIKEHKTEGWNWR